MENAKKLKIPVIMSSYFLTYMMMSGQFNYLSLFLAEKGMTNSQIGIVLGLPPFVAIVGQYFWSGLSDRLGNIHIVAVGVFIGSVATLPFYLFSSNFLYLLVVIVVYNFFSTSIMGLFDTLNMYRASEMEYKYGPLKIPGTIGYLVAVVCLGFIMDIDVNLMIIWQLFFGTICIFVMAASPSVEMPKMKKAAFNPMVMLKKPSVICALMMACTIHFVHGVNSSFFALFIVREMGAAPSFAGLCSLSSVAVELVFLMFCDKIVSRVSTKTLLFVMAILQCVRLVAFGTATNLATIWIANSIDGISTVATGFFMVTYFKRIAPPEGKASAQALVAIMCSNGARAIGSMTAPIIFASMGSIQNTYLFLAIVTICAGIIFFITPVKFAPPEKL